MYIVKWREMVSARKNEIVVNQASSISLFSSDGMRILRVGDSNRVKREEHLPRLACRAAGKRDNAEKCRSALAEKCGPA